MDYSITKNPGKGKRLFIGLLLLAISVRVSAQQPVNDSLLQDATLDNVIQYALRHQPAIQQALVNEQITEYTIKSRLADWYPQINFGYTFQHNFRLPVFIFGTEVRRIGVENEIGRASCRERV